MGAGCSRWQWTSSVQFGLVPLQRRWTKYLTGPNKVPLLSNTATVSMHTRMHSTYSHSPCDGRACNRMAREWSTLRPARQRCLHSIICEHQKQTDYEQNKHKREEDEESKKQNSHLHVFLEAFLYDNNNPHIYVVRRRKTLIPKTRNIELRRKREEIRVSTGT